MNVFGLFEVTRRVVRKVDDGFIATVGVIRHDGEINFIADASRWKDELAQDIHEVYKLYEVPHVASLSNAPDGAETTRFQK